MTTETRRDFWLDKPEEFYRWSIWERRYVRVEGRPVHFDGWGEIDAFLAKHPVEGWFVYHGPDGCAFTDYPLRLVKCPVLALMDAKNNLVNTGKEKFIRDSYGNITECGLSPRYRWDDEVDE